MIQITKSKKISAFFFLLGLLSVITFVSIYNNYIYKLTHDEISNYLGEIRGSVSSVLMREIQQFTRLIENTAFSLSRTDYQEDEDILQAVKDYAKQSSLSRLHILSDSGKLYASNRNDIPQYDPTKYQYALQITASSVSNPRKSESMNRMMIEVAVPLYLNGAHFGILIGSYEVAEFETLLANNFLTGDCSIDLALSDGTMISLNTSFDEPDDFGENVNDFYHREDVIFFESTPDEVQTNLAMKNIGYAAYTHQGISRHLSYGPVGIDDWIIAAVSTQKSLQKRTFALKRSSTLLVVAVSIVVLLLTFLAAIRNLKEQKIRNAQLKKLSETDGLTGFFNKSTTETRIKDILRNRRHQNAKHALMIIDIDNFKNINDKLGHLYGDIVLTELSEALKPLFRTNDIIGRVGGDEFFVFLQDFNDETLLIKKAIAIGNACRKTYSSEKNAVTISASIGIAVFPQHGSKYETLYKNGDIALYDTKAKGKDGYTIYSGQQVPNYQSKRVAIDSSTNGKINTFTNDPERFVFRLLYETPDTEAAIIAVLKLACENFRCSRGYVFEFDKNKTCFSNTYTFCMAGIISYQDQMQNIPLEAFADGLSSLRKNGYYTIYDTTALAQSNEKKIFLSQGIKAITLSSIVVNGEMQGFVGFDDCVKVRVPTKNEFEIIITICRLVGTFLNQMRTLKLAKNDSLSMHTILNAFEGYSYVVDYDSYEILFESDNIALLKKCVGLGKCCYKTYMNLETPCKCCPIAGLTPELAKNTVEIDNQEIGICLRTTASRINWENGKENYLISSIDVTEYKKL